MALELDIREKFENFVKTHKEIQLDDNLDEILARQLPKIQTNDKSESIICEVDKILSEKVNQKITFEELHTLIYCGAKTVTELCKNSKIPSESLYKQSELPKKFPYEEEEEQKLLYKTSPLTFKQLLFQHEEKIEGSLPTVTQIEEYWSGIWEKKNEENGDVELEKKERERIQGKNLQTTHIITETILKKALKHRMNWSSFGVDGVHVFWYKKFKSVRSVLLDKINNVIQQKEKMPDFFTTGLTELNVKKSPTDDPANYRPITYLSTIYKIIMRCIYQMVFEHYEDHKILAEEQSGGRKNYWGVRKALVIDSVASHQESLKGYYVDFSKAFDSVPHEWVLKMLRAYKVDETLVAFLESTMTKWKTRIFLAPDILTRCINFKRGVFQGDPMSVLLFWTVLNPLSFRLRELNKGVRVGDGVLSHVLFIDDLKLYASNSEDLEELYETVRVFCKNIGMEINEKKTHKFPICYLGYNQEPTILHEKTINDRVRKFYKRDKKIEDAKISPEGREYLKKMFLFKLIFDTFGVLHWEEFDEKLPPLKLKTKCLPQVEPQRHLLNNIQLKLLNDMCKMRRNWYKQAEESELFANVAKSDTVTPLNLSQKSEREYIKKFLEKIDKNIN